MELNSSLIPSLGKNVEVKAKKPLYKKPDNSLDKTPISQKL